LVGAKGDQRHCDHNHKETKLKAEPNNSSHHRYTAFIDSWIIWKKLFICFTTNQIAHHQKIRTLQSRRLARE
jgi:hypothetical protein